MPLVSVIIPVYNVEQYLRQCIDSVRALTLFDIEIICVNDSSTDGSLKILEEYAQKDERIKVVTQPNGGAGAARNRGLSMASGKYLSFLDSDDFFEPEMLELAYQKAEEDKADFVVFNSDQYYTDKKKFINVSWTLREKELPPYTPFNHRQMTDNIFKVFVLGISCIIKNLLKKIIYCFRSRGRAMIFCLYSVQLQSQKGFQLSIRFWHIREETRKIPCRRQEKIPGIAFMMLWLHCGTD